MVTRSRRSLRAFLGAAITVLLASTGAVSVGVGPAEATTTPTEIAVVPADLPDASAQIRGVFWGATGFAYRRQGVDELRWTEYDSGQTRSATALQTALADHTMRAHPGGGDLVAMFSPQGTGGTVEVGRPDSETLTSYPVPDDYRVDAVGSNGTRALILRHRSQTVPESLMLLDLASGGTSELTGLPDTVVFDIGLPRISVDGNDHALVPYRDSYDDPSLHYALVDLDTGAATPIPGMGNQEGNFAFTPSAVAWAVGTADGFAVAVLTQQQILSGDDPQPAEVPLPGDGSGWTWSVTGDHVIAASPPNGSSTGGAVLDLPLSGGTPRTLLKLAVGGPVDSPDGGVVITGGADAAHADVHHFTTGADGTLVDRTALRVPPVVPDNAGLTMAHGNLRHIEATPHLDSATTLHMYNHGVRPGSSTESPYGREDGGAFSGDVTTCEPARPCIRGVDGSAEGLLFTRAGRVGVAETVFEGRIDGYGGYHRVSVPVADGRLADASYGWTVVTAQSTGKAYLYRAGYDQPSWTGSATSAALWDDTLWLATASGTITERTFGSDWKTVVRTIHTGVSCQPDEVQVAQHWLYWSCAGKQAGIYDLTSNAAFVVPAGRALLGDGYLAMRHGDELQFVDVHTDQAMRPQHLAYLPASTYADDRGIGWTVDRFSGAVAYADAADSVHVLATGVPGSPVTGSIGHGWADPRHGEQWGGTLRVDRPVDAWQLRITRAATGDVVDTQSGGFTQAAITVSWGGKLDSGELAPSGDYDWELLATVDGVTAPVEGSSGQFAVHCGAVQFRDYNCNGQGAVLKVNKSTYSAVWRYGDGDGKLHTNEFSEDWPLGTGGYSMLIPFGDLNGDGYNDLLVRNNSGDVGGYLGYGLNHYDRHENEHVTIGSGYGGFTAIVSTGDLNDDGIDDLVVRNSAGVLYFKAGTGKSQFKPGVRFTAGWNKYVKLIGAGDLDGDGCGDLMAVDGDGVMWFYRGTKDGKFATKVRVGAGWAKYNSIIGIGDLTGDAVPDLIARDSAGTIWRYDGTGHATWSTKTQITTGWSNYAMF
jgi:hypothetical protein